MNPLVFSSKFVVKGHDVNSDKFITIPALLRYMQEAFSFACSTIENKCLGYDRRENDMGTGP